MPDGELRRLLSEGRLAYYDVHFSNYKNSKEPMKPKNIFSNLQSMACICKWVVEWVNLKLTYDIAVDEAPKKTLPGRTKNPLGSRKGGTGSERL